MIESRLIREARQAAEQAAADDAADELVGWLLWALDLPEVRAKLRALTVPPQTSGAPVPARRDTVLRRRGR